MLDGYFWFALAAFAAVAMLNLALLLSKRFNQSVGLATMGLTELVAISTLALGIIQVSFGASAATSTVEYFFYAVCALLIPLAGVTWTFIAANRWAAAVYLVVAATEIVMLVRMHQIWFA
jgi:hypothetical protein